MELDAGTWCLGFTQQWEKAAAAQRLRWENMCNVQSDVVKGQCYFLVCPIMAPGEYFKVVFQKLV